MAEHPRHLISDPDVATVDFGGHATREEAMLAFELIPQGPPDTTPIHVPNIALEHLREIMTTEIGTDCRCIYCAQIIRALPEGDRLLEEAANRPVVCRCDEASGIYRMPGEKFDRCGSCGRARPVAGSYTEDR